jgi:CobN/Magnesium Chelatase/Carboxypeptidase regulatory-like domain
VLEPAKNDNGNNFVDNNNGLISGTVKDDKGNMLEGVKIELQKPDGTVVKTTTTNRDGVYVFSEVEPDTYVIKETTLAAYPLNISDYDASDDGDVTDPNRAIDDEIGVVLNPGEKEETDNNLWTVTTAPSLELCRTRTESLFLAFPSSFRTVPDWSLPSRQQTPTEHTSSRKSTRGESVVIVLPLVGAEPVKEGTGRVLVRYDLIPLAKLGRPRVDVLASLSGIFRDFLPTLSISLMIYCLNGQL